MPETSVIAKGRMGPGQMIAVDLDGGVLLHDLEIKDKISGEADYAAKIGAFLKANRVDSIQGKLRFDGVGNFGDDLMRIKQVQNGKWVVVWPKEMTAGGAKLLAN